MIRKIYLNNASQQIILLLLGMLVTLAIYGATESTGKKYTTTQQSYQVPEVNLLTTESEEVALASLLNADDTPVLLNFIFTTCPGICPVMSATFSQFQQQLGTEANSKVRMISISIDPEYDTPALLKEYAKTYQAGPQWHFLTGRLEDVIAIQKAFDIYRGAKMNHDPVTFLRASATAPWTRIEGLTRGVDLLAEYQQLSSL